MPTGFSRALNEMFHDGTITPRELEKATGYSATHLRNIANGETGVSDQAMEKISRTLVDDFGETRQVQGMLGMDGGAYIRPEQAEVDECLLEEMAEIQKLMTYADDAVKKGEASAARRHMAKVKGLAKLAFEEVEALTEMHQARGDGHVHMDRNTR